MRLGVCYYPEHWDAARWGQDAKLLRGAGLTIVRMAEFAWSRLEPREGAYEFGWLDKAIETFEQEGFQVVLGTPTAAPPAWLSREHPDTLPVEPGGHVKEFGGRRHYCPNSATYRDYTRKVVHAMAARYGQDGRVIGWQIDNEFGGSTVHCYCENCAAAFRVWLEKKYKTPAALNEAWGNVFWSQAYTDWSQIAAPPVQEANPSHWLDYARFASDSFLEYQQLQIDVIRAAQGEGEGAHAAPPLQQRQFITHNFMGLYPDLDAYEMSKALDFVTWDSYPTGHGERWQALREDADDGVYAYDVGNPYLLGLAHAVVRGSKDGAPFWIMEQQAGHVNWGFYNPEPRPNVLHLWLWHNFAAGVSATLFFRERATWFAQEQYHSGLMNHDGSPAQGYLDLLAFKEQHALMQTLEDTRIENEVALLISYEDLWAIQAQPHRQGFSYWNVVFGWYAALQRAGVGCDVVSKHADISRYKLVIAPSLHLADEALAAHLKRYAEGGGLLVLGIRSGFKTPTNLVRGEPLPGALRELVGATVTSWQSLPPQVSQSVALMWRGWQRVNATRWVETLETDTAGTIASYVGNHLDGRTAMTVNPVGKGRVMYVGWLPNQAQTDGLVGMVLPEAGIEPIGILPQGVVAGKRVRAGETYLILMNFTDEEKRVWVNGGRVADVTGAMQESPEVIVQARGTRLIKQMETNSNA